MEEKPSPVVDDFDFSDWLSISTSEWNSIFNNDNLERFSKLFQLLPQSQMEWALESAGERNSVKIVKFILDSIDFDVERNKSSLRVAVSDWSLDVIKLLLVNADEAMIGETYIQAVDLNKNDLVKYLIEELKVDFDQLSNIFGQNALWTFSYQGNFEMVKYLITEKGAKVDTPSSSGESPLIGACTSNQIEIVKYLVEKGADVAFKSDSEDTPFSSAAERENFEIMTYLLSVGSDPDCENGSGSTPLLTAAMTGKLNVVKYLVETNRVDLNKFNKYGENPVLGSAKKGKLDILKYLIEKGAKLDVVTPRNESPLLLACWNDQFEVSKWLIETQKVDLNSSSPKGGSTPLLASSIRGNLELVKYLVEKGASVSLVNERDESPLFIAKIRGYSELVKYLEKMIIK